MITIAELDALRQAWRQAENDYLTKCQQHEIGLIRWSEVKAALNESKRLEAAYDKTVTEYQQQAITGSR